MFINLSWYDKDIGKKCQERIVYLSLEMWPPSFTAQTTHEPINFPKDYEGKYVVLFSHSADFTPVCTTEYVAFSKRYDQFKELNAELIGLSID